MSLKLSKSCSSSQVGPAGGTHTAFSPVTLAFLLPCPLPSVSICRPSVLVFLSVGFVCAAVAWAPPALYMLFDPSKPGEAWLMDNAQLSLSAQRMA